MSAEEVALLKAIKTARGHAGPAEEPWKEASLILDRVNGQLKSDGYKSVKIDTVYRRLKPKVPRS